MAGRHHSRKFAMQVLYQSTVRKQNILELLDFFIEEGEFSRESIVWGRDLVVRYVDLAGTIDELIKQYAIGWTLERISLVDLSILRLAFIELLEFDTPHTVVLNEAIELAKSYSADSPQIY